MYVIHKEATVAVTLNGNYIHLKNSFHRNTQQKPETSCTQDGLGGKALFWEEKFFKFFSSEVLSFFLLQ